MTAGVSRTCIVLLIVSLLSLIYYSCNNSNDFKTAGRIRMVENSLSGWVRTDDDEGWSLEERMEFYKVPGLCIAVVKDYRIDWVKGYGFADLSEQRTVNENTLFQAASISKCLNSLGVLALARDSLIDLNRDVNDYLTSWKFKYRRYPSDGKITASSLLSHTAGLTLEGFAGYRAGSQLPTITQTLDSKSPSNNDLLRVESSPGKRYSYSGGGILITQLLITDVTGRQYEEYMRNTILLPLGMTSSFYTQPPPDSVKDRLATGYMPDGNEISGKYHIYPEQAAAGLWTNPADLARYIIDTQLSLNKDSGNILSKEMTILRLSPVRENSAMGAFIDRRGDATYFWHSGGSAGFSSVLAGSMEDGNGAVIMVNSDNGTIMQEILNSIATVYGWKDYYNPQIRKVKNIPVATKKKYEGEYRVGDGFATVRLIREELYLNVFGKDWRLFFTTDSDCFVFEEKADLRFVTGNQGSVTGISKNGVIFRREK